MNSIISWVGGKKALRDLIYLRMPKNYDRYIEVFGGGGWVLFGKPPDKCMEVYNDFNSNLANLFYCVKERPMALLRELSFLPLNSRDEFTTLRKFLTMEEFKSEHLAEELEIATHFLKEPEATEIRDILMERAAVGDVKRAAAFYKIPPEKTIIIFDDISLSVPRGKITAIMGPSGIGKTTLLRLIGGQIPPDRGEILFDGENVPQMTRSRLYTVRKRMSMLFQSGALFTDLNVFDNVAYPLREHTHLPPALLHTTVMMKLEAVGLRGAAKLMPSELSGGMARRAALARAIALEPDLIMFDEPFVGQDPITMGVLVKLISELNSALGVTCIVVSHDVPEVLSIADYAYIVADKKIVAHGSAQALQENCDPRVRQFLDGIADGPVPFRYPAGDYRDDLLGIGS